MGRRLIYGKYTENLIEITLVYAEMANENEELKDVDSIAWGQKFVEWANEFEEIYSDRIFDCGKDNDYYEIISEFAKERIIGFAQDQEVLRDEK